VAAISGLGVDLLEVERLRRAIERRPGLAARLFTEGELGFAASRAEPTPHLAARFCAKEAVAKALTLEAWSWQDIEVVREADGAPRVVLHGPLAGLGRRVEVSLTHDGGMAAAVAVVCA